MSVSMSDIKALREKTGAGVMDAKKALEASNGDMKQAEAWIAQKGLARAEKKSDRETAEGRICSYVHHNGKVAAMVKLLCETDFVARNQEFIKIGDELAMQAASMQPENLAEFLQQEYLRDSSMSIEEFVKKSAAKLGENVQVAEFVVVSL